VRASSPRLAGGVVTLLAALATSLACADVVEVTIQGYLFLPAEVTVKAGTTVKWINNEKRASHSVLFPSEGARESERLLPGDSWQRRFDRPGRYPYTCGPHPEMHGVIIVTE
jgi:plastocyanin